MGAEKPPEGKATVGRRQICSEVAATSVVAAEFTAVTNPATNVPLASYWSTRIGTRNVRPRTRRPSITSLVPQLMYPPTPAAYEPDPVLATVAPPDCVQPPVSCPVASLITSPLEGTAQVKPGGNNAATAVKKATTSAGAVVSAGSK